MPRIEFHFNAPSLVGYACRLIRKIQGRQMRAQVLGSPTLLAQLDQSLWTFSALDFLPHCLASDTGLVRDASCCLLTSAPDLDWSAAVLINLGDKIPDEIERFDRVVEVVSSDELQRAQARQRWRQYTAAGHVLVRHDLSSPA